jgi:hypothetical protein
MCSELIIPQAEKYKILRKVELRAFEEVNAGRVVHFGPKTGLGWTNYITNKDGVLAVETYGSIREGILAKLYCSQEQAEKLKNLKII